jgi:hypothetical protein
MMIEDRPQISPWRPRALRGAMWGCASGQRAASARLDLGGNRRVQISGSTLIGSDLLP